MFVFVLSVTMEK